MSKNGDNGNIQYAELRSGGQFINSPGLVSHPGR